MNRPTTRITEEFLIAQRERRVALAEAPGQAGGLPAVNTRIEIIEHILAIHAHPEETDR